MQGANGFRSLDEIIEQLKGQLQGWRKSGSEFAARCPGHDDKRASLTIRAASDRVLVDCKAGCDAADLLGRIGMTVADLYPKEGNGKQRHARPQNAPPRIVAQYVYTDELGKSLFRVARYAPKDFRQERSDGKGGWVTGPGCMEGVRRVLYQLPLVIKAHTVFVVEGEKAADRINEELGNRSDIVATCSPGGAGKWKPEHSAPFSGKTVFALPDNDDSGRRHTADVNRDTRPVAKLMKIVALPGLPEKGDVYDWLEAGHTVGELLEYCQQADREGGLRGIIITDVQERPTDWLVPGLIPCRSLSLWDGDGGHGKSTVALALAVAIAQGFGFPHQPGTKDAPVAPGRVLIFQSENSLEETMKPKIAALGYRGRNIICVPDRRVRLNDLASLLAVEELIIDLQPRLVIFDPFFAYIGGKVNLSAANEVREITTELHRIAELYALAVLLIRHLNKADSSNPGKRGMYSVDLLNICRSACVVGRDPEDEHRSAIVQHKNNLAPLVKPIGFTIDAHGALLWTGDSDLGARRILSEPDLPTQQCMRWLRAFLANGPRLLRDIREAAEDNEGFARGTLYNAKRALRVVDEEIEDDRPRGRGSRPKYWRLP